MTEHVLMLANRLNALTVETGRQRLDELGSEGAGAYNFYRVRLDRGDMFADCELQLAAKIAAEPSLPTAMG